MRPFPRPAVARRPLPRRTHARGVPDRPGGVWTRRCRHPEPGDACPGVPRPARPQPGAAGPHQGRARRQEDHRLRGHDPRSRRRRHLAAGRHRPTGRPAPLRERAAHHGSRPAQGQGQQCSDDATDRPCGHGRQGLVHHRSRHPDAWAPKPPGRGQDAASAGFGSGAWRGVPAPGSGSEVSAYRQGMGRAVWLACPASL
jgi:hypothetical protein